jgi:hypothetical protein
LLLRVDIPAVVDVNGDGDKDILRFSKPGGYVMYFENLSEETGHGLRYTCFQKKWMIAGEIFMKAG